MSGKRYSVIGHPIGHTMSPFIHKRLFEINGICAEYSKLDIAPEKLNEKFNQVIFDSLCFNFSFWFDKFKN